jgi:hypothetical protein
MSILLGVFCTIIMTVCAQGYRFIRVTEMCLNEASEIASFILPINRNFEQIGISVTQI